MLDSTEESQEAYISYGMQDLGSYTPVAEMPSHLRAEAERGLLMGNSSHYIAHATFGSDVEHIRRVTFREGEIVVEALAHQPGSRLLSSGEVQA